MWERRNQTFFLHYESMHCFPYTKCTVSSLEVSLSLMACTFRWFCIYFNKLSIKNSLALSNTMGHVSRDIHGAEPFVHVQ